MKSALIAMSGGVDSSVAALLVSESGMNCIGATMKLFENGDTLLKNEKACCSLEDSEDARSVAVKLGMPYYVFNFTDQFRESVIERFINSYENGITPNPCIDCNRYLKFEKLFERMTILGCDKVVTGHYARVAEKDGKYCLLKGLDESKDQSYVLYRLTQKELSHVVFPLGELRKTETRQIAEDNGFINARKKDSQDICFVPDGDYASVIEKYSGKTYEEGDFVLQDGSVIGKHKGILHYTIGQRKGLGIAYEHPLYVCNICPKENRVVLSDNDALFSSSAEIKDVNWISGSIPDKAVECTVKIRYKAKEVKALVTASEDGTAHVEFSMPQRAVTPGQSCVFYDGEYCIGGGVFI